MNVRNGGVKFDKLNPPRRHHYIPIFYLRKWTSANGKLVEFSKPYKNIVKPRQIYPAATGYVDRLYELKGLSEDVSQEIESNFFSPLDSQAASVLDAFYTGTRKVSITQRFAWTKFVISLAFRNPESLRAARVALKEYMLADPEVWKIYIKHRRPADPPDVSSFLNLQDQENAIARSALHTLTNSIQSRRMMKTIFEMKWGSIDLPLYAPALLTSDRPVYIVGGLSNADCESILPIGPKKIFWACRRENAEFIASFANPIRLAEHCNQITTCRAEKFVYGMTDRHLDFVQDYMGTRRELTIPERATAALSAKVKRLATRTRL